MTGTISPPRRAATAAAPPSGGRPPAPTPAPWWRSDPSLPATVAITLLTLSVAVGFSRLFSESSFLAPVVLSTIAAHAVAWWCRRNRLPTGASAVATFGAVALVATWTVLGHTTAYGLPLPLSVRGALEALSSARGAFRVVHAPTAALPGFVLACIAALGVSAFMADWAAFRLQATFEAIIPAFSLFLFSAALGTAHLRTMAVAMFVAATLGFVVVHGLARSNRAGAWFGGRPAAGPSALARNAALLGAVALVAGLAAGPHLPFANSTELLRYKNRPLPGPSNRATISPLVDIRGRLDDRRGIEVFTVKSPVKAYWRLTSLDTFDGTIWSSNDTYRPTKGGIGTDEPLRPDLSTQLVDQEFSVSSLSSIWLPAAFRPARVQGIGGISYNRDTASIITKEETTDGDTYTVRSAIPALSPDLLASALPQAPPDIAARYLSLPPIDTRVQALAARITVNAPTPYAKAKALQDFFRNTGFVYDLNARPGHDSRALENFLLRTRRGYCEQFAGAYAVLARLVGLPTRVAVGFTPGELQADGLFHVRDEHAHSWPEVYLHGFGWVPFEPTVSRGNPQAEQYTGVPAQQEESGDAGATTTTVAPAAGNDNPDVTTTIDFGQDSAAGSTKGAKKDTSLPGVVKLLLAIAAVALLWALVIPGIHLLRRWRRWAGDRAERAAESPPRAPAHAAGAGGEATGDRRRTGLGRIADLLTPWAPGPSRQALAVAPPARRRHVLAAWADLEETLDRAGIRRRPSETMFEYVRRAAPSAGLQREANQALRGVATTAATAAYGEGGISEEAARKAVEDAAAVRTIVLSQMTFWERARWWLDPRPLLRARAAGS